jgi:hypothetical protein
MVYVVSCLVLITSKSRPQCECMIDLCTFIESCIRDKRLTESWEILKLTIPGFCDQMCNLAEHRKLRKKVCAEVMFLFTAAPLTTSTLILPQINTGHDNCRSDDTGLLKTRIINYLLLDTTTPLVPPINPQGLKTKRGWAHPVTAGLLCPIEYPATQRQVLAFHQFTMPDKHIFFSTYDAIQSGAKRVDGSQLPRFLYPGGHEYDPDDMVTGLLHGHLVLRVLSHLLSQFVFDSCFVFLEVAKHIFQGPSAALEEPGYHRGKGGNAAINGISSLNARAIAYVACQVGNITCNVLSACCPIHPGTFRNLLTPNLVTVGQRIRLPDVLLEYCGSFR